MCVWCTVQFTTRAYTIQAQELARSFPEDSKRNTSSGQNHFAHSLDINFYSLGERYVKSALTRFEQKKYFVDKLPLNFLNIGYINRALPAAKIILVERNPMDSCYSIYKNLFNRGYSFSYNLDAIADFYISFRKIIDHWRSVLPDAFLTVQYEKLVTEPRRTIENMLGYCAVEWEDSCLEFHKNKKASTTASASQVREPMYKTSIENWKNYKKQLEPIEKRLSVYLNDYTDTHG